ncbi:iron-containing alcohol dehydrogenase [Candidatus Pacearchaeota archaeon]|nr:iron-containing alcohol dehydrogenase [Candidatus Pacearchaeota archaeon]
MIKFDSRTQIIISEDLPNDVLSVIMEEKVQKIGLIIDRNVAGNKNIAELIEILGTKVGTVVKSINISEPTTYMVNEYSSMFKKENIDFFIGIGGGSTIDLTKAVSAMVVNPGDVEEYHGTNKEIKASIKKMMIPTTAGTGSEVTPGAVLTNKTKNFKRGLSSKCMVPDYAVLSAKLTVEMPERVAASTGMDALGHAIESYTAKNANDITRMYSKEAFRLVFNNLMKVFNDKNDLTARKNIQLGACLAGYAIYNSNTGACHALSYPLGIYHNVPHGVAVALLLPEVVGVNIKKGCDLYSVLYDLIENKDDIKGPVEKSYRFYELLKEYLPSKHLKTNLRNYGVDESNYEFLAERGLDLAPALNNNPVTFDLDDSKKVLQQLI